MKRYGALLSLQHRRTKVGLCLWSLIILLAILAPMISPHDPNQQDLQHALLPPVWFEQGQWSYLLGTNILGQCQLSQLLYGFQVAVIVALAAALLTALIGCLLGICAGYFGHLFEKIITSVVEMWMTFPAVVLALLIMVALSPGLTNIIIAIILVDWTRFCKVILNETKQLKQREFIAAARIAGASHLHIIAKDILPNLMPSIVVLISIELSIAVVVESTLAFVGISVQPEMPSWGGMIAAGLESVFTAPWLVLPPMLCIIFVVFVSTLLSDGLNQQKINGQMLGNKS